MTSRDLIGCIVYCTYYIGFAALLAVLSKTFKVPKEIFRKSYHILCSLSVFILIRLFDNWYAAVLASMVPFMLGYLAISLSRKFPVFAFISMGRDRQGDELAKQIIYALTAFVLLVSFCWGLLGPEWKFHAAVGIMAWGFGDAISAIVGKRFGKRKVNGVVFDSHKTVEGTSAGALGAFAAIFGTIMYFSTYPWYLNLLVSIVLAVSTALLELVCRNGVDNLILPVSIGLLSVFMNILALYLPL